MSEIPSIWRTELWHPMMVHFPIVLLLGAALLRIIHPLFSSGNARFIKNMSRVSLYTGILSVWITIYTGTLADSIVTRTLCDPTVLEAHENAAFTVGYFFSAAVLLDVIDFISWKKLAIIKNKFKGWLITLLLVVGSLYLGYTAHLGASLVYQQSAAVYQPTEGCTEFE
ncbi:MAG: hypothetical protein HUJ22_14050 [Gracilimonas sp.]|uniref:DUF2231 domain-containing protein n=1 Tax=Gracilimonas sp. TaxID=1974203 RepID=UPI0019CBA6C9|nr:DUF2231 domain-containing protein [Gracilimonas sp.]MBD3617676.1 hypothetical protein [Gracilimonas sp.]